MSTAGNERRQKRSERPIEALHHLLEATVARFNLKSACLASPDGLVLVAAGDARAWDTIAAYAPLLSPTSGNPARSRKMVDDMLSGRGSLTVRDCTTPAQQLFLVALGADELRANEAADHGRAGTERILAA